MEIAEYRIADYVGFANWAWSLLQHPVLEAEDF